MKRVLLLVALLALALPCTAGAAVTASQITTPADPFARAFDLSGGQGPYGIQVAGTATGGGNGEKVDVRCYGPDGPTAVLGSFTVDATTRTFGGYVEPGQLTRPCVLRAVPTGQTPADVSAFKGVRVYPTVLSDARVTALGSPNAGTLYDVFDRVVPAGRTATLALGSFGGCGLYFARPLDPGGDPSAPGLDVFNCAGWADLTADGTSQSRSDVVVDGRNAFTAGMLQNSEGRLSDVPGMPPLAVARTYDPASGELKLDETSAVVRCAAELNPFPPADAAAGRACGTLTDAGVRLFRTSETTDDGRVVQVTDRWSSTDGAPHALDLLLEIDLASTAYGLQVPWVGPAFSSWPGTATLPPAPAAPGSILVRADASQDGSLAAPVGAVTFGSAPDGVEFYDDGKPISRFAQLHYVRTVPATGELVLQHAYAMGTSPDAVRALAARNEDRMAGPALSITQPAPGSTVRSSRLTLAGRVSDNGGVAKLTLNGTPIAFGADGSFTRAIRLPRRGANVLAVAATDLQGNVTQVQVPVTYAVPGAPCVVPRVIGLTRRGASARLRRAGCRLGAVSRRYVKPRRVRKGRRVVVVRVRTGRIVAQRVKPGAKVARGTKVRVTVQGRRPPRG